MSVTSLEQSLISFPKLKVCPIKHVYVAAELGQCTCNDITLFIDQRDPHAMVTTHADKMTLEKNGSAQPFHGGFLSQRRPILISFYMVFKFSP